MPIQKTNRALKQYMADLHALSASDFLDLIDSLRTEKILSPVLQVQINLQHSDANITGDIPEVRGLLSQVDPEDHPQSYSATIATNTNPRKNLSISISFAQRLVTFNGQALTRDESKPLIQKLEKILPEAKNNEMGPQKPLPDPIKMEKSETAFLPGAFRPIPIPETSDRDVFVIMSFSREHRDAYHMAIEPILAKKGFRAVRVDEIQHNTTVTVEIIRQIEKSAFVVADLTGERPNVYYEVGYAHRADKEVILMARKDTAVHFDVAAINRIDYEDFTELSEALSKRIDGIVDRLGLSPNLETSA